jgi:hypothetical protein
MMKGNRIGSDIPTAAARAPWTTPAAADGRRAVVMHELQDNPMAKHWVDEAALYGRTSELPAVRVLIDAWTPAIEEGMAAWLLSWASPRGPRPIAPQLLRDGHRKNIARATLCALIDCSRIRPLRPIRVALEVGARAEPFARSTATWSADLRLKVGEALLRVLVRAAPSLCSFAEPREGSLKPGTRRQANPRIVLALNPEFSAWLDAQRALGRVHPGSVVPGGLLPRSR